MAAGDPFLVILERFNESLLMFALLHGWPLDAILYVKQNVNTKGESSRRGGPQLKNFSSKNLTYKGTREKSKRFLFKKNFHSYFLCLC